jgi:hypothetical protein
VFSLNCLRGSSLLFTPSRPVCLFGEKQRALRAAHFKNLPSVVYLRTTQIAERSKHWPVLLPFFQKIKKITGKVAFGCILGIKASLFHLIGKIRPTN